MSNFQGKKARAEYISRINRVADYIKCNFDSELSLEKLSNVAAFSKYYFHRIFKSISGESLNSFVSRVRLEKSAFLLEYNRSNSITSIAYDCCVFLRT